MYKKLFLLKNKFNIARLLLWGFFSCSLFACSTIPVSTTDERLADYEPKITEADFSYNPIKTPIGQVYEEKLLSDPEITGAELIEDGVSAFVVRAAFARMATETIDLQTYIYGNDSTSNLLVGEMKKAADRGVKVRVLIDDYGTKADLVNVMLLNSHQNIEVKVFNAVANRSSLLYYPQFLMDFNRLNSRMHNKLFIVDNVAYITGGRNVGDNYFYPSTSNNFSDTDVLFLGHMTRDATKSFDDYWNHHLAVPADVFNRAPSKKEIANLKKEVEKALANTIDEMEKYNKLILFVKEQYINKKFNFSWGEGKFLYDSPEKVEMTSKEKATYQGDIVTALEKLWDNAKKSVYLSAAYFVPGKESAEKMVKLEEDGVHMTVVTNSLSSSDASIVYAKWENYRTDFINAGADVYEFMVNAENLRSKFDNKKKNDTSFSALHSKTIVFDDEISWIGSFNLDPRSALYNTENVAIFKSKEFAERLKNMVIKDTKTSWKVGIEDGEIVWRGSRADDEEEQVFYKSPDTSFFQRVKKMFLNLIPEKFV